MSWLSSYVSKAESLLNALDSSAGDLLSTSFTESADSSSSSSTTVAAVTSYDTANTPDVSALSSSYLSQQSPLPSFAAKRTAGVDHPFSSSTKHTYSSSRVTGTDVSAPPLTSASRASSLTPATTSANAFGKQASPSVSSSKRQEGVSSALSSSVPSSSTTVTSMSHYSLDSSRLSQQLMRGSVDASHAVSSFSPSATSASATVSNSSTSSSSLSKSTSVIPSASGGTDEEALLKFLNAPLTPTSSSQQQKERKITPSSSTPRVSPTIPKSESSMTSSVESVEESHLLEKKSISNLGDGTQLSPEILIGVSADSPKSSEETDAEKQPEVALPSTESILTSEGIEAAGDSLKPDSPRFDAERDTLLEEVQISVPVVETTPIPSSSSSSSSIVMVSSSQPSLQQQLQPELMQGTLLKQESGRAIGGVTHLDAQPNSSPDSIQDNDYARKSGSSNGGSVSGSSMDGEDADLSDAIKDSAMSPFEESEPEMLHIPPSLIGTNVKMARSSSGDDEGEGATVSPSIVATEAFSESEPEMIPTPPSAEEAKIMSSSQISSQRFSDCEILSGTELAEIEDGVEDVHSPMPDANVLSPQVETASQNSAGTIGDPTLATMNDFEADSLAASKLQLENQLLRSEIHALNEEMQGAWQQTQMAKEERVRAIREVEAADKRAKEGEDRIRELSNEFAMEKKRLTSEAEERLRLMDRRLNDASALNADAQMSLEAKDGQLAVLRVRLDEADATIDQLRRSCQTMEEENRRVVAERETTVATHITAFETLKAHADRIEEQLATKTSEGDRLRDEVFHLENASAEEKEGLGALVTSLQSELAAEKSRCVNLQHQANGGLRAVEAAKKELEEYRAKATRTLQSKDRVIASLQQEGSSSAPSASALELDDVKNERDLLREELDSLHNDLDLCRNELAEAETQAALERDNFESRLAASEKEVGETKARLETITVDLTTSKQELVCAHDQLHKTKIQFQEENLKKSEENENLKRQMQAQSTSSASTSDLEARLHALAENLIEKQTTIETLSTEKTSLKMQLERLSATSSIKSNIGGGRGSPASVSISVDDDRGGFVNGTDSGARMRLPLFLRETPDDTGVTRGVKRAATSLDALGIKLGVFLRRYPIARVFALVYAIVLHLWVFVVLLTYTPEMH